MLYFSTINCSKLCWYVRQYFKQKYSAVFQALKENGLSEEDQRLRLTFQKLNMLRDQGENKISKQKFIE